MSNLLYGLRPHGRYIHAAPIMDNGYNPNPDEVIGYLPDVYDIIAYNSDGTKTAIFGAGSEANSIEKMTFELSENGCSKLEITFRKLPENTELNYRQRIDIHLFNDPRPWWSGYIITRPVEGTTEETFKFTGHGYFNLLEKVLIFSKYENMEISAIVADIARQIERKIGLQYNGNSIINTGYTAAYIEFDGVTAKEALKQLSDFAVDYVYGVNEYRQLYFKPRVNDINEQARFWIGEHLDTFVPTWDVEKVINVGHVKGGNIDDNGEQWLAVVEDAESQLKYGIQEKVLSLPSAYSAVDAQRWGENQIERYKEPTKSAKVTGVKLDYPKPDGSFFVRKLSTDGQAVVTDNDGVLHTFPISKLKYTVSRSDGIKLDMELDEQPFAIDKYLFSLERDSKIAELLQQASTKQLKTGG